MVCEKTLVKSDGFKITLCSHSYFIIAIVDVALPILIWSCVHLYLGPYQSYESDPCAKFPSPQVFELDSCSKPQKLVSTTTFEMCMTKWFYVCLAHATPWQSLSIKTCNCDHKAIITYRLPIYFPIKSTWLDVASTNGLDLLPSTKLNLPLLT